MKHIKRKYGFTLIELLVVVIIIAVLSAVALPMYKHAVLKSRFSTVMPMAKAVAEAQEVYFLGNNQYALSAEDLDVEPVAAEGTSVALAPQAQEDQYNYVAASSSQVPGARYIMYQKHSPKFADTIHCEADESNEDALWLCEKGLGGQLIDGSVNTAQGSYVTYLLSGTADSTDKLPTSLEKLAQTLCGDLEEPYCVVDNVKKTVTIKECNTSTTCVSTIHGEDGEPITTETSLCRPGYGELRDGVCEPTVFSHGYSGREYEVITQEDGTQITHECYSERDGVCYYEVVAEISGNTKKTTNVSCADDSVINSATHTCTNGYKKISGSSYVDNKITGGWVCNAASITSAGKCAEYSEMTQRSYSDNGHGDTNSLITTCVGINGTICEGGYKNEQASIKEYDDDGNLKGTRTLTCLGTVLADGSCSEPLQEKYQQGGKYGSWQLVATCANGNWETGTCIPDDPS